MDLARGIAATQLYAHANGCQASDAVDIDLGHVPALRSSVHSELAEEVDE
jgi:hypothetical protein